MMDGRYDSVRSKWIQFFLLGCCCLTCGILVIVNFYIFSMVFQLLDSIQSLLLILSGSYSSIVGV